MLSVRPRSLLASLSLVGAILAPVACSPDGNTGSGPGGKADGFTTADLIDGTAPAVGVLRFVNDPTTTMSVLDDDVGLSSGAASNIAEHRDGGADPFDDIAELDGVPNVGPKSMQKILDFALAAGFIPAGDDVLGTWDGVTFTVNQADAVVELVNDATESALDDELALDSRAVAAILETRPLRSVLELSELPFVGESALLSLRDAASGPVASDREIGVFSDLDKTVIPPTGSLDELPDAPYPGVARLYTFLENGDGEGLDGDVHYVTARPEEHVVGVPEWLEEQGVPLGTIDTGISGIPTIARDEKIRDITAHYEANPNQLFVHFGDSSHIDADAFRAIKATFSQRFVVGFIHNVKAIDPARLEGLILIDNYAEAAGVLFGLELLSESQARAVMQDVADAGLIEQTEIDELIEANQP